jgi:hypothetical protein
MMSKPEDFKFDSRVRDRFIRQRTLSAADLERHLEQLPDLEGEYDVAETPQPAVTPARSEINEEPLVFDGIRRLQAFADSSSTSSLRQIAPSPVISSHREPESRSLGTPLRSALMESEISGVGAGAVSAALGAMAAEQRAAAVPFVPSVAMPRPAATEAPPSTPVTLRSQATPPGLAEDSDDDVEPERIDIPPDSEDLS